MWYQTAMVLDTIVDTTIDTRIWPIYQTNTGLYRTQKSRLVGNKIEKFDLSFMIAWVNLSSNGSSVSRNVCQGYVPRSIYFPNLRSKPQSLGFTLCANEIVNEDIYINLNETYKVLHTVLPHSSHMRDPDPCKNIPTSFMDL
jgi:hypothetical protein